MNLAETIEKAISTKDWSLVCLAYENLTGKSIQCPNVLDVTDNELANDIFQLINKHKPQYRETTPPILVERMPKLTKTKKKDKNQNSEIPIDREPAPTPAPPPKSSHYGNTAIFVTEQTTQQEIENNRIKNEISSTRKVKRSPVKKYDVICDDCEKQFKSDRPKTDELGVKCSACIKNLIKNKGQENGESSNG